MKRRIARCPARGLVVDLYTSRDDIGSHTVCAVMTAGFLVRTPVAGSAASGARLEAFREKTSLQEARELCGIVSWHHVEVGFRRT